MPNLGRPRKIIDSEKIIELIAKGFTVKFVAEYFSVNVDTLYANYSDAMRKGRAFRDGCLQSKQFECALMGNATMQIWLGKQWLGQTDKNETTTIHTGVIGHVLTEADRAAALAIIEKLKEE